MKIRLLLLLVFTVINNYSQEKLNPINSCFGKNKYGYYKYLNSELLIDNRDLEITRLIIIPHKGPESCLTLKNKDFKGMDDRSNIKKFTKALKKNRNNYELIFKEAKDNIHSSKKRNWRKIKFKISKKEISTEFGNLLLTVYKNILKTTSYPSNEIKDTNRNLYYFFSGLD